MGRKITTKEEIKRRLVGRNIQLLSEDYTVPGELLEWGCLNEGCEYTWKNKVSEVLNNRSNCIQCVRRNMRRLSLQDMRRILKEKGGRFTVLSTEERKYTDDILTFYDHKNNTELRRTWEAVYKLTRPAKNNPIRNKEYNSRPEVKARLKKRSQTAEYKEAREKYRLSEHGKAIARAYAQSPKGKINRKLRTFCKRLRRHLQNSEVFHTKDIVYDNGYVWVDYLTQFNKGEYTWKEYNEGTNKYHIDHIIPVSYFRDIIVTLDESINVDEIRRLMQLCNCPENMRIWPKKENHEKYCGIDKELIKEYGLEYIIQEAESLKQQGDKICV